MTDGGIQVLVVEDDVDLQGFLRETLEAQDMHVTTADDGATTLTAVAGRRPDLVLLDLDLPDVDGLEVLARLRDAGDIPVIVLTGRRLEQDRVAGLELGADDYVVKPFSARELIARIHAVLRRAAPVADGPDLLTFGDLHVDRAARQVTVGEAPVALTRREFDLLAFLAAHPGRVFSREELLNEVWGSSEDWQAPATVTEHVRRIRLKLEADPAEPRWIHNVRGVGYRFEG